MIVYTVIILALLIFVHEFGHFITAKLLGVQVNEFALGMGPALFKKQKGETLYALRLIPIGGYCAMEGEDEDSESERAFNKKPAWAQAIILAAGAGMNAITAFLIVLGLYIARGVPDAFVNSIKTAGNMVAVLYDTIAQLFFGAISVSELSGPVGIAYVVDEAASYGIFTLLFFTAFLSMNLAVMNLLPLPALDGGRLFFLLVRVITRGRLTESMEARVNTAGMVLLIALMIYVTWNDIGRFVIEGFSFS